MALRQNAIPVGAIEYLLRGCGCDPEKERLLDLEKAVERGQGLRVDHQREHNHSPGHSPGQERDAAAYFDRAVGQGEPAGVWFGTGMESLGLTAREGDVARPDERENTVQAPQVLVVRPRTSQYPTYPEPRSRPHGPSQNRWCQAMRTQKNSRGNRTGSLESRRRANTAASAKRAIHARPPVSRR